MKKICALLILFSSFSMLSLNGFGCQSGVEQSISYFSQQEVCSGGAGTHYVYYERYLCRDFGGQFHYEYKVVNQTICQ